MNKVFHLKIIAAKNKKQPKTQINTEVKTTDNMLTAF